MANITIFNLTGANLYLNSLKINGSAIHIEKSEINMLGSIDLDYREMDWKKFTDFTMDIEKDGKKYNIDLNNDHYFAGSDYIYPGSGAKIRYILSGTSEKKDQIQMNCAYNSPDLDKYKYCSDKKYLMAQ